MERIILDRMREMSIAHLTPATGTTNLAAKEHAALTEELADITRRVARFADANEDEQDALREKLGAWGRRKLAVIARQPRLIGAVVVGVVAYFVMNWLMTSAPLAMRLCGLSQADANLGIQWHVLAMYAPSFVTGRLIARFSATKVVMSGLAICACASVAGFSCLTVWHFWGALVLIGIGWNFAFVGASAMVLDCYRPEERTRVQSMNDFAIFGSMVVASFASGGLLNTYGWQLVCTISFLPLLVAVLTLWVTRSGRLQPATG